ncbi:MAG TPA: G1 family glutamic endopeptidase [Gemmataceae bacterium]|nr:G1 family glutamic endopeptidase [Gemmataceae bacterium]
MRTRHPFTRRPCVEQLEGRLVPSTSTSLNWSGYAVQTNPGEVTSVVGRWVVPTVTGPSTGYAAVWVGIDGSSSTSTTVEQIGTESDFVNGRATYYAWYEMYQNPSVTLSMTVKPGDSISAQVSYTSSGQFALSITDTTSGKNFSTTKAMPNAQRSSAEWVVEAPSENGILPLAYFTPVTFTSADATITGTSGKAVTGAINNSTWKGAQIEQINMATQSGASEDTTSTLSSGGTSFTVTRTAASTSSNPSPQSGIGGSGWGWGWGWGWGGGGGWGWSGWRQTNVTFGSPVGLFPGMPAGSPQGVPFSFRTAPSQATVATSPVGVVPAALPATFSIIGTTRLHGADTGFSDGGAAEQPAMPQVAPDANEPGLPIERSAPKPGGDAFPMSPAASAAFPSSLRRTDAVAAQDCDACFAKGCWTAAALDVKTDSSNHENREGGLPLEVAAGVLLTVGVGGSWAVAVERSEERRRRLTLR